MQAAQPITSQSFRPFDDLNDSWAIINLPKYFIERTHAEIMEYAIDKIQAREITFENNAEYKIEPWRVTIPIRASDAAPDDIDRLYEVAMDVAFQVLDEIRMSRFKLNPWLLFPPDLVRQRGLMWVQLILGSADIKIGTRESRIQWARVFLIDSL